MAELYVIGQLQSGHTENSETGLYCKWAVHAGSLKNIYDKQQVCSLIF